MSGDLLELLFVAAFILFGLLGGRKKKRPPAPVARPRPRGAPPSADRTDARRPADASGRMTTTRPGGSAQEHLLRELEGLLTGRPVRTEPTQGPGAPRDVPDPDEARSLEPLEAESTWDEGKDRASEVADGWRAGQARAAETLETLEEAGGASHRRFHALYDRQPEAAAPRRAAPTYSISELRRAIVWSEILGPPVSER